MKDRDRIDDLAALGLTCVLIVLAVALVLLFALPPRA